MGLSRYQLWEALGHATVSVDLPSITIEAYNSLEKELWEGRDDEGIIAERGHPWHTSFHASAFPFSRDIAACGRAAMYQLMDIPDVEPIDAKGRSIMLIGKATEEQIVYRWARAGLLVSGGVPLSPDGSMTQTHMEDPEYWLTGSPDAVLDMRKHGILSAYPVDVKSKELDVIMKMRDGEIDKADPYHIAQLMAYIWLCRLLHEDMGWDALGLEPARSGMIYYAARSRPAEAHGFHVRYDEDYVIDALEKLRDYQEHFEGDILPVREKAWMWTSPPCDWCPFKKHACKPDVRAETQLISDSNGIAWANTVSLDNYDYDEVRRRVLERWNG